MNPRLEIASRLLAGMMANSAGTQMVAKSSIDVVVEMADALIKECGDEPSVDVHPFPLTVQSAKLQERVDEVERKYLSLSEEHNRLRASCQKLVEEWSQSCYKAVQDCRIELESVLKGGSK